MSKKKKGKIKWLRWVLGGIGVGLVILWDRIFVNEKKENQKMKDLNEKSDKLNKEIVGSIKDAKKANSDNLNIISRIKHRG